jgi:hypothetical protein
MEATWEFVKRHRSKIAVAATVVGGIYATKKVLDHQGYQPADLFKDYTKQQVKGDPILQVCSFAKFINSNSFSQGRTSYSIVINRAVISRLKRLCRT